MIIEGSDPYPMMFGAPITVWWRWFAWYPVNTVDHGWVWLRVVNRRRMMRKYNIPQLEKPWFQHAVHVPKGRIS